MSLPATGSQKNVVWRSNWLDLDFIPCAIVLNWLLYMDLKSTTGYMDFYKIATFLSNWFRLKTQKTCVVVMDTAINRCPRNKIQILKVHSRSWCTTKKSPQPLSQISFNLQYLQGEFPIDNNICCIFCTSWVFKLGKLIHNEILCDGKKYRWALPLIALTQHQHSNISRRPKKWMIHFRI